MKETSLPEKGFLRINQILSIYPVSRSTWWAGVKAGRYPAAVKLGPNTTAWRAEEIHAFLDSLGG